MIPDHPDASPPPRSTDVPTGESLPPLVVRSEDLLAGRREVFIRHGESLYRLRVTAQGRLILTK